MSNITVKRDMTERILTVIISLLVGIIMGVSMEIATEHSSIDDRCQEIFIAYPYMHELVERNESD